jgi:hypothetical protein
MRRPGPLLGLLALMAAALAGSGCSARSDRLFGSRPGDPTCVPGTFIGSMTMNCPDRVRAPSN